MCFQLGWEQGTGRAPRAGAGTGGRRGVTGLARPCPWKPHSCQQKPARVTHEVKRNPAVVLTGANRRGTSYVLHCSSA